MPSTASAVSLPFDQAIDFFRQKVDVPADHWTTLMDEAHSRGFAVAGATSEAVIGGFRKAVDTAIAEGTGFGAFKKEFDEIVAKNGWKHTGKPEWRARIIYDTNLSTAFSAGRYVQQTLPEVLQAFPYLIYDHTPCQHPRLQHLAWDGMLLRADDPFWNTCYPPNGWGCRCRVRSVSEAGMRAMGKTGPDASPKLQWREYVNRTTGRVTRVPTGCDPGFAYNPGKAWKERTPQPVRAERVAPAGAPLPVLAPPGQSTVKPAVLQRFLDKPAEPIQVGKLDKHIAEVMQTGADEVILPPETMKSQAAEHPDVGRDVYAAIDNIVAAPEMVLGEGPDHQISVFGIVADEVVRVVLDTPLDGQGLTVRAVQYVRAKDELKSMRDQANKIWGHAGQLMPLLDKPPAD